MSAIPVFLGRCSTSSNMYSLMLVYDRIICVCLVLFGGWILRPGYLRCYQAVRTEGHWFRRVAGFPTYGGLNPSAQCEFRAIALLFAGVFRPMMLQCPGSPAMGSLTTSNSRLRIKPTSVIAT